MPIDFSPLANIRPVNLQEIYANADNRKLRQLQTQVTLEQLARNKKENDLNDAINQAYVIDESGAFNPDKTLANLYRVSPKAAMEFQASQSKAKSDALKASQENENFQLGKAEKLYNIMKQSTGFVMANPTLENAVRETTRFGQLTGQDVSAELQSLQSLGDNPDSIRRWAAGHSLSADKLLPTFKDQDVGGSINSLSIDPVTGQQTVLGTTQKTVSPDAQLSNDRAIREGAANRAVTIRGQNMTDARSREANSTTKAPSGFRFRADGTLEAIPGGPGDRKANPTEGQGKASLYATRAAEADAILNDLGSNYSRIGVAAKNSGITEFIPGASTVINSLSSDNTQSADQAQRNFINAILRQESGAAISASEFDNARKQYFPQPGDSDALVKQKAANRQSAINGLNAMSGPLSVDRSQIIPKNEPMPAPKIGTVVDGYVFKGGNPADSKNWKKK